LQKFILGNPPAADLGRFKAINRILNRSPVHLGLSIGGGELDMISTVSFIQANLQHSIVASGIIARTVSSKTIDMALIQEPWYCKDCIKGLNIPGYTLYWAGGMDRPRACILVGSMTSWMPPSFSCKGLVPVLV
jgi:hypothetical protein